MRLDPGLAFGTGTHPIPRMCLRWIATQEASRRERWARILDYGCGSGIWPSARRSSAPATSTHVDIDPAAVQATQDNAAANGVAALAAP